MFATGAQASSIGLNFTSNSGNFEPGPNPVGVTDLLGVVPQQNWNNTQPLISGTTADVASPSSGVLVDSAGAASAVSVSWGGTSSVFSSVQEVTLNDAAGSSNGRLYKDYLESDYQDGSNITVSFSSVPYAVYDVYVYVGDFIGQLENTSGLDFVNKATLGSTSYFYANQDPLPFNGFVRATATSQATWTIANYVHFEDVVGESFTVDVEYLSGNRAALSAIQIVEAPEASAMSLLTLGVLGILRLRRAGSRE